MTGPRAPERTYVKAARATLREADRAVKEGAVRYGVLIAERAE